MQLQEEFGKFWSTVEAKIPPEFHPAFRSMNEGAYFAGAMAAYNLLAKAQETHDIELAAGIGTDIMTFLVKNVQVSGEAQ